MTEIEVQNQYVAAPMRGADHDQSAPESATTQPDSRAQACEALFRAQAEYDPALLRAAEARVMAVYHELALLLVRKHERRDVPTDVTVLAALLGLGRAVQNWSKRGNSSDFEEFARGRIEAEIGAAHALHDGHVADPSPIPPPQTSATTTPAGWPPSPPIRHGHHHGTPPPARFKVESFGDECYVTITGPLDVTGAEDLAAIVAEVTAPHRRVRLDLADVTFFAAAGLRSLVDAHRSLAAIGGELVITGVNVRTRRLMQITGHDRTLHVEPVDAPPNTHRVGAAAADRLPGGRPWPHDATKEIA